MGDSRFDFVNVVVADRDLVVTSSQHHACRLEPRESDLAWYCDLDDGTPTGDDDPAFFVRWVCPALRIGGSDAPRPLVDVHRSGPQSDLGKLLKGFGRLAGRASRPPGEDTDGRMVYNDPDGVLDAGLRRRIESWPSPPRAGMAPPQLSSIRRTGEGLIVESVSWWNNAPALDHQIGLGIDIARRLSGQP